MAWLRTREIKPGIYETQSAGVHGVRQLGMLLGMLLGGYVAVKVVVGLFNSGVYGLLAALILGIPLSGIAYWHYSYYKTHPREPRQPGPWD
jgi:hypothetical protein